jgi:hypothetical protein
VIEMEPKKMAFAAACAAMQIGEKVRRTKWDDFDETRLFPLFIVMVPGRQITVSYEPMVTHLGEGTVMTTKDHYDAIFSSPDVSPFDDEPTPVVCEVGFQFSREDIEANDWVIVH